MAERLVQKLRDVRRNRVVRVERGGIFPGGGFTARLQTDFLVTSRHRDEIILTKVDVNPGCSPLRMRLPLDCFPDYTNEDRVIVDEEGIGLRVTFPDISFPDRMVNPNRGRRTPNICAPYRWHSLRIDYSRSAPERR